MPRHEFHRNHEPRSEKQVLPKNELRCFSGLDKYNGRSAVDRLFVWNASALIAGELTKAGFLARAGKLCAVEMTASVTLERLLEDVFADYLQATSAKMAGWSMRSAEQRATVAQK